MKEEAGRLNLVQVRHWGGGTRRADQEGTEDAHDKKSGVDPEDPFSEIVSPLWAAHPTGCDQKPTDGEEAVDSEFAQVDLSARQPGKRLTRACAAEVETVRKNYHYGEQETQEVEVIGGVRSNIWDGQRLR